jgi:hypothetical protein
MQRFLVNIFVGLIILISFYSCKSCKKETDNTADKEQIEFQQFLEDTAKLKEELHTTVSRFPTPGEMFGIIKEGGITFDARLLNPDSKIENYTKFNDRALNLGVYIADFAYITLFGRQDKAVNYLKAIESMSQKIGINAAIDKKLIERIKKNINNIDSLSEFADEAFLSLFDYCDMNDLQHINVLIATGAYIEGIYIALNNVKQYSDDNPVLKQLANQKQSFGHVLAYAEEYQDKPGINEIKTYLIKIDDIFQTLKSEQKKSKTTKNSQNKLIFSGGKKYKFTEDVYKNLKHEVNTIRTEIVNAKK